MKYYHGTTKECAESIEAEGFRGGELDTLTDGITTLDRGGVVYVYDNAELAAEYGDAIYEIELLNGEAVPFQEDWSGNQEYYIPIEMLKAEGIYKRI